MTKLKNTKKGMAKKALSISLVAAMLATSNVPVWAAEFTDGVDTIESFSDDAPVVNNTAPIEEEVEGGADTYSAPENSDYSVTADIEGVNNGTVTWNQDNVRATFTVTPDSSIPSIPGNLDFYYVWRIGGKFDTSDIEYFEPNDGQVTTDTVELTADDCDKTLQLYIWAEDGNNNNKTVWSYTSDLYTIKAINVSDLYTSATAAGTYEYNGEPQVLDLSKITLNKSGNGTIAASGRQAAYKIVQNGNHTDATDSASFTLVPTAKGYTGQVSGTYTITPKELNGTSGRLISDHMTATLKTTSFVYTGDVIRMKKDDIILIDKKTEEDLSNYIHADENGYVTLTTEKAGDNTLAVNAGDIKYARVTLVIGTPETGTKNYILTAEKDGSNRTIKTDNTMTVTARDLSTVKVSIKSKTRNEGKQVVLNREDITFTDGEGNELDLYDDVQVVVPDNATGTGTYTATIKANSDNVTGSTTASFRIVTADISAGKFANELADGKLKDREYTGEQIVITKADLGELKINGQAVGPEAYEIVNGTNTNVKAGGTVTIKGLQSFEGSQKILTFAIKPASVSEIKVTNDKVERIDTSRASDYKDAMGIVVKAKNAAVPAKEFTLVEGQDYKVNYSFKDNDAANNVRGKDVTATVTITNPNFMAASTVAKTVASEITAKALKAEYIKFKESSFTYNGSKIEPEFDIVIDGKVINPAHYKAAFTNNLNAGTATLTVTGDGENYSKAKAQSTFTIKAADASKLTGVIGSKEYKGYSITLNPADIYLTLDKMPVDVASNFSLAFGENIQIGDGTVTLTPKNGNFTGTKTLTFKIVGEVLGEGGTFTCYDENGRKIDYIDGLFRYDGTAHTFASVEFAYGDASKKLVEGTDYDLIYADNVYGKKSEGGQYGAILAVAKGKYGSTSNEYGLVGGVYTDAEGNKISNVIAVEYFEIDQQRVSRTNVTVSNGVYAGGLPVKPVVSVVVKGVTLVEGKDYDLELLPDGSMFTEATTGKPYIVDIICKNGYKSSNLVGYTWGIDKFDLADADVAVEDGKVVVKCGRVDVEASEYTTTTNAAEGTTTITAVSTSKNYTGSKTFSTNGKTDDEKPETPMISDVKVVGNKATVILSGESDGATGYDYVISKDRNCITTKDYDKVNKNILTTSTAFTYTQQGTYYAYCHAWKRVNGVKVFSGWSNAYPFVVTAITPKQPVISKVKVNGSTVTVTYTKAANATGYDVILGKQVKTVSGEKRPVDFGTYVKKVKNGNTVTVTFKNVAKGTYYAGLHAYNRTSEDGKKVFSPWSNAVELVVK